MKLTGKGIGSVFLRQTGIGGSLGAPMAHSTTTYSSATLE
jgi:hypothetical protein